MAARLILGVQVRTFTVGLRPVVSWRGFSSKIASYTSEPVTVTVRHGFPVVSVPLPSRRESCDFTLRPYLQSVGDFVKHIKSEDLGVESVVLYSLEGNRIAQSTGVDILLQSNFDLVVNDFKYRVEVPQEIKYPLDGEKSLSDVRNMIHKLYTQLNVDTHQLGKERELRSQLNQVRAELVPLEAQQQALIKGSKGRSNWAIWGGMAFMSLQFGFFARLTWWEYSWDIMEPVTYFATYATSMAMFAYFVITRQDYVFPVVEERTFLHNFYRMSNKHKFDVDKFNHLKDTAARIEGELQRLHDPLQLNIPTPAPDVSSVLNK